MRMMIGRLMDGDSHSSGLASVRGLVVAVTLVAAGCAHGRFDPPPPVSGLAPAPLLTPQADRITDEAILKDYSTLDAQQGRIQSLNASGVPMANYHLAKAQAYLDLALDEYNENDRSPVTEQALGEADRLLRALEAGTRDLPVATYPLEGVTGSRSGGSAGTPLPENRLRPDLWELAERIKQDKQFRCATIPTAQFEVALLHAIHEDHSGGWRRTSPYIATAEALAARAQEALDDCVALERAAEQARAAATAAVPVKPSDPVPQPEPPVVTAAIPVSPPDPAPQPVLVLPPGNTATADASGQIVIILSENVYFPFRGAEVTDAGKIRLRDVATILNGPAVRDRRIFIDGHTDNFGGTASNQRLSERRAEAVRQAFIAAGVQASRLTARGFGETRPAVPNRRPDGSDDPEARAQNRRVELVLEAQ